MGSYRGISCMFHQFRSLWGFIVLRLLLMGWAFVGHSSVFFWFIMEASSIFILFCGKSKTRNRSLEGVALYFVVGGLGRSLMAIGRFIPLLGYDLSVSWFLGRVAAVFFYFGWVVKMGLFPIAWMPTVVATWGWLPTFLLLGVNKFIGLVRVCFVGCPIWLIEVAFLMCACNRVWSAWGTQRLTITSGLISYSSIHTTSVALVIGLTQGVRAMRAFISVYVVMLLVLLLQVHYLSLSFSLNSLRKSKAYSNVVGMKTTYALFGRLIRMAGFPLMLGFP